ncbi:MAG: DNA polymerase III subunit alpha [Firmicutes bacterium]|nr:DNA polymerase III subunit alpha [Bacillota bacterium]
MPTIIKTNDNFVHLHNHTEFSLLDGANRISDIFPYVASLKQQAVAITDHGNMYGALQFVKEAVKFTDPSIDFFEFMAKKMPFKVKPIIGCEVYMCNDRHIKETVNGKAPKLEHLVLLCKNEIGYKNLIKMVSVSNTEGFYYKPRVDMELLKQHHEGLICLSACLGGSVPQALLDNNFEKATAIAKEYKALFGDDYYIEIQDHNLVEQRQVLPHLIRIARELNIKLVATNDTHYLKKEDWAMQKVLQCISMRKNLSPDEISEHATNSPASLNHDATASVSGDDYFTTHEYYFKSRAEMEELFTNCLDALDNTVEIASKCEPYFFERKPLLPEFTPPNGLTPAEYLRKLTYDGLAKKYPVITNQITTRADYELGLIERLGFVDYFLIVWDFIAFANSKHIAVGPGRGSGAGSIVAFALDITKPDPLKYQLIFERFLNPDRISNPDFDIDFCVDRREEVINYVVEKYGAENVCQIITFGSLKSKQAFKDVGRVLGKVYAEMDRYTKLFPGINSAPLAQLLGLKKDKQGKDVSISDLVEVYQTDPSVKQIFDMAIKVEGFPRQTGIHPAGVIICRDPIYKHVPLSIAVPKLAVVDKDKDTKKSENSVTTTQFDMNECEQLGLLKMDFLGLRTLTDIKNAIDMVEKSSGKKVDFYGMEYNDKAVFDMIGEGDTVGVFQLESGGMTRFMTELKPSSLEDIIAGVALYRPGPMDYIPTYVANKRNPKNVKYDHPMLENILDVTYGVMVYQEQVIQVAQQLAGYSVARGDVLRAIIGKKKMDLLDKERSFFIYGDKEQGIIGAINNDVNGSIANKIFDDIVKFGNYAFNKSHATAYAYVAYQTAYLKKYHPVEYIASVLNNRIGDITTTAHYLQYAKQKGITVLPPDINYSVAEFSVENGSIRIGLNAIKNVGIGIIEHIVAEREKGGVFTDFDEFITRMSFITINKRVLEGFILTGVFDSFNIARSVLKQAYTIIVDRANKDRLASASGQISMFDNPALAIKTKTDYPKIEEYSLWDKLRFEKETAGIYLTGHPLENYADFLSDFDYNSTHFTSYNESVGGEMGLDEANSESEDNSNNSIINDQRITVGGMLVEASKKFTKMGKEIGIGKLEDLHGTIEVFLSGHGLNKYKNDFIKDQLVTLSGTVRLRDDGATLWINEISPLNPKGKEVNKKKICFYCNKEDAKLWDELQEILFAYPGHDDTYIKSTHDNKIYPLNISVQISKALLMEIEGLLGDEGYKIA